MQQSQVQTIQRTVTSRNVTQDETISGIAVADFAVNAWGLCVISYDQNQENGDLENYIFVRAFKHRPVPIAQMFCIRCMLWLLQSWRFQQRALPGQAIQIVDSHVFFQTRTHLHWHKYEDKNPLFKEIVW